MIYATLDLESKLWHQGKEFICGVDEVGRGSFAGPVVVGAVVFSSKTKIPTGIADSKLLNQLQREKLEASIKETAVCWAVARVSVEVINKIGIGKATQMAFRRVLKSLTKKPSHILIDAFYISHLNRKIQSAIKKGDRDCVSIAAASIIAKVYRDDLMRQLHKLYPQYGFEKHKGYGTKDHQIAIKGFGFCREHRRSFSLEKFL